jgi:predicted transposase/invertase (TIGR01784 family)
MNSPLESEPRRRKGSFFVDVRCIDNKGRQFIVEMQMLWTDSFKSRVLFNASKAYIRQLDKGVVYKGLQPVYALSVVNDIFEPKMETYYHHYKMVHSENPEKILNGLQLVFVEIPKFKTKIYRDKKLSVLWLRFLSELENYTEMISQDLLDVPEIKEAIELTKESSFTKAELEAYDKFWESVSSERSLIVDAEEKGRLEGIIEGEIKGEIKGKIKGEIKGKRETAKNLLSLDVLSKEQIAQVTGLSLKEIEGLG